MYHEYPFAFRPSTVSVMPLSQERILRWSYLRLDQSAYHGWLSMMTSSEEPPFLVLPRAPPTLNPPLPTAIAMHKWATLLSKGPPTAVEMFKYRVTQKDAYPYFVR